MTPARSVGGARLTLGSSVAERFDRFGIKNARREETESLAIIAAEVKVGTVSAKRSFRHGAPRAFAVEQRAENDATFLFGFGDALVSPSRDPRDLIALQIRKLG